MRTRREIEDLLAHCRSGECTGDPIVIATWIEALEWMLAESFPGYDALRAMRKALDDYDAAWQSYKASVPSLPLPAE